MTAGLAKFIFEDHPEFAHVDGEIIFVEQARLQDFEAEHALGLKAHQLMPEDAVLSLVSFRVRAAR